MKRRKLHSSLLNGVKLKSMAIPEKGGWRKVEIYKLNSSINFNGRRADDYQIAMRTEIAY